MTQCAEEARELPILIKIIEVLYRVFTMTFMNSYSLKVFLFALSISVLFASINGKDLIESFDLAKISRNPPHYEPGDVAALSRRWLHGAPWESVAESLDVLGLARAGEAFWIAVRGNLERLEDVCDWWAVCTAPLQPRIEDADFAATAADLLPPEPWDAETWKTWTAAVREATGTRGKALFLPLRLALTGREHGPELAALLPFIGRARVLARLAGEKA